MEKLVLSLVFSANRLRRYFQAHPITVYTDSTGTDSTINFRVPCDWRSFLKPWLRCVGPLQENYVIWEIDKESCSMHVGPRSVVANAMRLGYYWPTKHQDTRNVIRACNDCQIHRLVPRNLQQPLTPITAPWLFYKWRIDIAGPFPEGPGKVKFLIVAMDYFIKWIEAKAVSTITGNQVKKFVWDNIVCRFVLPGEIVSNNGK
ncbi:reverse transcriptase domain-containing protein [Tanacetum coccineum]